MFPDYETKAGNVQDLIAHFEVRGIPNLEQHFLSLDHPFPELEGLEGQEDLAIFMEVLAHLGLLPWSSAIKCCVVLLSSADLRARVRLHPAP